MTLTQALMSWGLTVGAVYALLLATYAASCLVVGRLNRRLAAAKLQPRQTTPAQIRRDRRQSIVSLAGIAAMFGTGHFVYAEYGWGWAPLPGVLGAVLSFILSLVLFDAWFYWFHRLIHTR